MPRGCKAIDNEYVTTWREISETWDIFVYQILPEKPWEGSDQPLGPAVCLIIRLLPSVAKKHLNLIPLDS